MWDRIRRAGTGSIGRSVAVLGLLMGCSDTSANLESLSETEQELTGYCSSTLTASPSPRQPSLAGGVTLEATASCLGNDALEYRFSAFAPRTGGRITVCDWQSSSTCSWNTSSSSHEGNFKLLVDVKRVGGTAVDAQKSIRYAVGKACPSVSVSSSPSPAPGDAVTLTATATCDAGVVPEYLFEVMPSGSTAYTPVGSWQASPTAVWNSGAAPAGTVKVRVTARKPAYRLAEAEVNSQFVLGAQQCAATSLRRGDGDAFLATASCSGGAVPEYRFVHVSYDGTSTVLQDYGPTARVSWPSTGLSGTHFIQVLVRAQGTAQPPSRKQFTVKLSGVCTNATLMAPATAVPGQVATFTAAATCPTAEFQFQVKTAVATSWTRACAYSTSPTCNWTVPAGAALGTYNVRVFARKAGTVIVPSESISLVHSFQVALESGGTGGTGGTGAGGTGGSSGSSGAGGSGGTTVERISAGAEHTCVTRDGQVFCWGEDGWEQTGDGIYDMGVQSSPIAVVGLTGPVQSLGMGAVHSCALLASGTLQCWGSDNWGELGDNTHGTPPDGNRASAVNVLGLSGAASQVAGGSSRTCAVLSTGALACWGRLYPGEIVNGSPAGVDAESLTPFIVEALGTGVAQVSLGWNHTCALLTNGGVKCWGANNRGQLGNGTFVNSGLPVEVVGVSGATQLSLRHELSCARLASGGVSCWGDNRYQQLGGNMSSPGRATAELIPTLTNGVAQVAAGRYHACALLENGTVQCWGSGESYLLGIEPTGAFHTPVQVSGLRSGILEIAAGELHTCALFADDDVMCWGENEHGQLGNPPTISASTPISVVGWP